MGGRKTFWGERRGFIYYTTRELRGRDFGFGFEAVCVFVGRKGKKDKRKDRVWGCTIRFKWRGGCVRCSGKGLGDGGGPEAIGCAGFDRLLIRDEIEKRRTALVERDAVCGRTIEITE